MKPLLTLRWIAGFSSLLLLLAMGLAVIIFPQPILTVDSGPVQADVLVVLGGGDMERPARAAELFRAGAAPRVIFSGFGDASPRKTWLTNAGVPAADIQLEPRSLTTRENALFTIAILRARHLKSAIIVTSWYHSRRALACFEHFGPDLKFYSRPAYFGCPWAFSKNPQMIVLILKEYGKLAGYGVLFGVSPLLSAKPA